MLQECGINASDLVKVVNCGFGTIESVLEAGRSELVNIKGISEAKVDRILEASQKIKSESSKKEKIAQK